MLVLSGCGDDDANASPGMGSARLGQLVHAYRDPGRGSWQPRAVARRPATLGDNARQPAPMTADDQTRPATPVAQRRMRRRLQGFVRRVLLRVAAPYARRRARKAGMARALGRLEADFEHVRRRHTEQIERLEDIVRELVLTAESLRRASAPREDGGGD
jgi:hypothetical protein